ncbi:hypothetical protein ElyMa_002075400 [Elysia marginata]|uniref:Uncharacterized protein n=1 Tax=Elysia marginata TaxID=1093978 RepID=A0AAV4FDW9_9GAST|nr:hypothetical protein ElyMa_002075400 [Elysia marginata]
MDDDDDGDDDGDGEDDDDDGDDDDDDDDHDDDDDIDDDDDDDDDDIDDDNDEYDVVDYDDHDSGGVNNYELENDYNYDLEGNSYGMTYPDIMYDSLQMFIILKHDSQTGPVATGLVLKLVVDDRSGCKTKCRVKSTNNNKLLKKYFVQSILSSRQ